MSIINFLEAKELTGKVNIGDAYGGYGISKNIPLSNQYGFPVYVVKFSFKNFDTSSTPNQEHMLNELLTNLQVDMDSTPGLYTIRFPAHIMDLVKSLNESLFNLIFVGGTVYWKSHDKTNPKDIDTPFTIGYADKHYLQAHRSELLEIASEAFSGYQSQYHLNPLLESGATDIYRNWFLRALEGKEDYRILIVRDGDKPIAFNTFSEDETEIDDVVGGVLSQYRGHSLYRIMVLWGIRLAKEKNKTFTISTQFDNFTVQRAWVDLQLKPYKAIYNFHYDSGISSF